MGSNKDHVFKGLFYILVTLALSMVLLFPVFMFLLPIVFIIHLFLTFVFPSFHLRFLFQLRSVCKIE